MPANKYALLRYRIIDRCLTNKGKQYPTKEQLRQACETELYGSEGERISLSTIDKDLYAMRNEINLGYEAPIAHSAVHGGYYYTDPDYSIEQMPLSNEDIEAIEFAANTLAQFRSIDAFKTSGDAIDKILDRLKLRPATEHHQTEEYVQFETAPVYRGGEYLSPFFEAIREQKVVRFRYAKFTGSKEKEYLLHPYLLKEYRNRWYIVGFNPDKKSVVVFGLDRIESGVEDTGRRFVKKADFDPDTYFKHSIGITTIDSKPVKIQLRFSPLAGKYVESQPLHESQKILRNDEVALEVELYLRITKELIMQILSYGEDVEVKAPTELRSQITRSLKNTLKNY